MRLCMSILKVRLMSSCECSLNLASFAAADSYLTVCLWQVYSSLPMVHLVKLNQSARWLMTMRSPVASYKVDGNMSPHLRGCWYEAYVNLVCMATRHVHWTCRIVTQNLKESWALIGALSSRKAPAHMIQFSLRLAIIIPDSSCAGCTLSNCHNFVFCKQMGIAMTDPDPLYHPERLTMFDPMASPYNPDEHILSKSAHFLGNLLRQAAAVCTGICTVIFTWLLQISLRKKLVDSLQGLA